MSLTCEAFLFMASRAQLVAELIRPSSTRARVVISDRFLLANVVYQGHAGGLDPAQLWHVGLFGTGGLEPDLTFVLDLPLDVSRVRRKASADRMESRGDDYFAKVRAGFLAEARRRPEHFRVIDATTSADDVQEQLRQDVLKLIPKPQDERRDSWGYTSVQPHGLVRNPRSRSANRRLSPHPRVHSRLAHAYLFVGPAGIGKRLFAKELAKALLCEAKKRPGTLEACDQCESCLLVDAGTHPDLFQVSRPEDKNEMPAEVMTNLCRDFCLKAARGHGKIGLIDDADDFNEESANCFLKTLEEPPPGSIFILLGTSLDRQLATIKSRCQMVRFAPLPDNHVRQLLQEQGVEDAAMLDRLVRLSGGSPGQALALADETLWQFRRSLLQAFAQPKVDSVALGKSLVEFAEEAGKETASQRRRATRCCGS